MYLCPFFIAGGAVDFNFVQLVVTLRLEAEISDACALFGIRADFEAAFRRAATCPGCMAGGARHVSPCPYQQTFAQAVSTDPAAVRRYQKPPLPFVFAPPLLPPPPNRGTSVELGLILTGSAITHIPVYLAALRSLFQPGLPGRRLQASLLDVATIDYHGNRTVIMAADGGESLDRLVCLSAGGLLETACFPTDRISLTFTTPLRLMQDGKPVREPAFSPLLRGLLRRVSAMAYYYGGIELEADYPWLASSSRLIETVASDCRWVEWSPRLGGLIGSATFAGDLTDFHYFLLLGEYLQVGKGAAFGLGHYRIASPDRGL